MTSPEAILFFFFSSSFLCILYNVIKIQEFSKEISPLPMLTRLWMRGTCATCYAITQTHTNTHKHTHTHTHNLSLSLSPRSMNFMQDSEPYTRVITQPGTFPTTRQCCMAHAHGIHTAGPKDFSICRWDFSLEILLPSAEVSQAVSASPPLPLEPLRTVHMSPDNGTYMRLLGPFDSDASSSWFVVCGAHARSLRCQSTNLPKFCLLIVGHLLCLTVAWRMILKAGAMCPALVCSNTGVG